MKESVRLENPDTHEDVICEMTRARALLGLLYEVDPMSVIEGTELSDEHEKFNVN